MSTITRSGFLTAGSSLGLKAASEFVVHDKVLDGFVVESLARFEKASHLPGALVLEVIGLPERALTRRKAAGKLAPEESERLLRLARVFELATELFNGERDAAARWLQAPARSFGGRTPLSLIRTEVGARQVEDLIGRLEHGVYT